MIQIKTAKQIEAITIACGVVHEIHDRVRKIIRAGLSTAQIDNVVKHSLRELNAKSAFLRYRQGGKVPFPANSCISVNEEVVHGIGRYDKILQDGDIITVDIGANVNGFIGDAAVTHIVGQTTTEKEALVKNTELALYMAIKKSKPGALLYDACALIEQFAKERNYGVVTQYYGHGVGLKLHEPPQVPNYRPRLDFDHPNIKLQPGMIFTYEPMYTLGSGETEELNDGWTVITKDCSVAAHWEHTILITDTDAKILT